MRERIAARETLMTVILRHATEADAKHVVSLLAELGYPSTEADVHDRLCHSLHSQTSCFLVAQSASDIIGLISAELVPYFPIEDGCSTSSVRWSRLSRCASPLRSNSFRASSIL